jgi:phosphohistidine phosphatase SixA
MMVFRCATRVALLLVIVLLHAASARAQSQAEILVAEMQDGGKVIYLRHSTTVQSQVDTGRLGDRAGQRNLSPAGIAQAKELGRAFRMLNIPMNEILASPVFRARDTAELAFGAGEVKVTMDVVADDYAGTQLRHMLDSIGRLLRELPGPGMNRIIVGHRTPLEMVTKRSFPDSVLPEGAMAVFEPGGSTIQLMGTITAERLIQSADRRRQR